MSDFRFKMGEYFGRVGALGGIIAGVVCILGFLAFFAITRSRGAAQKEAQFFVDGAMPAIAKDWDPNVFHSYASVIMLEKNPNYQKTFDEISDHLGGMTSYGGSEFAGSMIDRDSMGRDWEFMVFNTHVTCERGNVDASIGVIKEAGVWRIGNFMIGNAKQTGR